MLSPTTTVGMSTKKLVTNIALSLIFERVLNYIPIPVTAKSLGIVCVVLA